MGYTQNNRTQKPKQTFFKKISCHWRDTSTMVGLVIVGAHSDGKLDAPPINTYLLVMAFVPLHNLSIMTSTPPMTHNVSTQ